MKKPVIGVVPLVDAGQEDVRMQPGYIEGVLRAGGLPILLPLTGGAEDIDGLLELCGGVLFTGGPDISPEAYGEEALPVCGELCPVRDRLERPLMAAALARDKAVLGICRGLQVMNTVLGGTLYQDLPSQRPSPLVHRMELPYNREAHRVELTAGTPLGDLLGGGEIGVNSCHHQGVRVLAPGLSVMASASDGLVEAVYIPEKRFAWAVQWHPERTLETDPYSQRIFDAFVEACRG